MKYVDITDEMIQIATEKTSKMGVLKNSIMEGEGSVAGFIGEEIINWEMGGESINTYDYDIITPNGYKIEVKTKQTKFTPKENYECSVAATNTHQKCDEYAFVRLNIKEKKAWILGYLPKNEYYKKADFKKTGDKDPDNGFVFKENCYNVKIKDLNDKITTGVLLWK